jgi:hypothetical protein
MTYEPPQPPSWPDPLQQPLPGPEPGPADEFRSAPARSGPGRVTIVLAALALLAVGLVVGLLLRGSSTPSAAATNGPAARTGTGNGAGRGEGRFFPGGGGAGGAGGQATQGTISSLSSDGFAMTTADGQSVTVAIGPTTTVSITVTGASSGGLAVGQPVLVVGTESKGKIAATAVREGAIGRFGGRPGGNGQGGAQPSGGANA